MYFNVLPGQNKNLYILLMFMFLVEKGILKEVHMDFMVSGHSYLPCDRGFGVIERACKRKQKIQCPDHYVRIIGKIEGQRLTRWHRMISKISNLWRNESPRRSQSSPTIFPRPASLCSIRIILGNTSFSKERILLWLT